jgi:soluble lytic murein transglycosylase-like protein
LADQEVGQKIADYLLKEVQPYAGIIQEAAHRFEVPPEIIAAVIMVESGGNTHAKAETSSASGLMQTISATFREARAHLSEKGMRIGESPFEPRASILAGTWYLDRMFTEAAKNHALARAALDSWRYPLEYYYAGPSNGRKKEEIVIIYAGGRKILVDKPAYSQKVLRWAKIMREQRNPRGLFANSLNLKNAQPGDG